MSMDSLRLECAWSPERAYLTVEKVADDLSFALAVSYRDTGELVKRFTVAHDDLPELVTFLSGKSESFERRGTNGNGSYYAVEWFRATGSVSSVWVQVKEFAAQEKMSIAFTDVFRLITLCRRVRWPSPGSPVPLFGL